MLGPNQRITSLPCRLSRVRTCISGAYDGRRISCLTVCMLDDVWERAGGVSVGTFPDNGFKRSVLFPNVQRSTRIPKSLEFSRTLRIDLDGPAGAFATAEDCFSDSKELKLRCCWSRLSRPRRMEDGRRSTGTTMMALLSTHRLAGLYRVLGTH